MDNAEKLQDVSNETPDEVQDNTESNNENTDDVKNETTEKVKKPVSEEKEETNAQDETPDNSVTDEATTADLETSEETAPKETVSEVEHQIEEKVEVTDDKNAGPDTSAAADKEGAKKEKEVEGDDEEGGDDDEEEDLDFSEAPKEEILTKIREVKNEENIRALDRVLKAIKPRFDEIYEFSKNEALQKYVSEGNEAESFEYHGDEADKEFITLFGQLRSKRNKHYRELENQKEDNLKKKERLLEQLREIVDGEESSNSINSVRDLQAEWKKTGPVPGAQNKTLWANYNALLDRYYDNRSIYFELKDLDRKKNFKLKEELCEKAESLAKLDDMKTAIVQLNDLHDEYKHIGPVPKEDQEPLWQRFKAASDAIYTRRKEYFDQLKVEFDANLVKKQDLIKEVVEFPNFTSDRITEWNDQTKLILDIQKRWEAVGGVPRDKAKEVNRSFWNAFKGFFANKNKFFKELESKREENLEKKHALIEKANELKDSDDWNSTADKLKHLQSQWKDIGPVPEKVRNQTYKKFKAACDHFFNKRREQNQEQFKAFEDNLQLKLQVCDQLEEEGKKDKVDLDTLYDLIDNFTAIGFVPKNTIKKVRNRFDKVKAAILANESISEEDRGDLRHHIEMGRLKNTPGGDKKIQRKEHSIRRKISTLESDISTWNTNMEFFANSVTADKLKADMQKKVEEAEKELADLKSQLASIS